MTALIRQQAYQVSEGLLRRILTSQPNLLKERNPSNDAGRDVALFIHSFIDQYASYLMNRPASP